MGDVRGSKSVVIQAPVQAVLDAVLDLPGSTAWFPGLISCEVLEADADGRPLRAHQVNDMKLAKDEYDLLYEHGEASVNWRLAAPSTAMRSSSGSWSLRERGGSTEVTLELAVEPSIPLPGFLVKKQLTDTLGKALRGLQGHCEG